MYIQKLSYLCKIHYQTLKNKTSNNKGLSAEIQGTVVQN